MNRKYFTGLLVGWLAGRTYTWLISEFVLDTPTILEPFWAHVLGAFFMFGAGFVFSKAFFYE